jgi:hypothetical protein
MLVWAVSQEAISALSTAHAALVPRTIRRKNSRTATIAAAEKSFPPFTEETGLLNENTFIA